MRIVFAGTPAPAVPTLQALLDSHHEVVGVVTRPPARAGRGRSLVPSAVATVAEEAGVPLIEASGFTDTKVLDAVEALNADLGVVVAYGALIPPAVLDMPRFGWVNLHFSDLPRWRGAAPVQWAVLSGDERTASSVFQLEEGLDTGPVFSRLPVPIGRETAGELLEIMSELGAAQILEVVDSIAEGSACAVPQDEEDPAKSRARQLTHDDGFIDFTKSAQEVDRIIRAVTPNPGAWTLLPGGVRLKLGPVTPDPQGQAGPGVIRASKKSVEVGCAQGQVSLGRVAPAGKGWMDAAAWARGARLEEGARLGVKED